MSSFSQEDKKQILVKSFVQDLFNPDISQEHIVSNYLMELKDEKRFSNSVEDRKYNQLNHIKEIRDRKEDENNWLMPNKNNGNPKNHVASYSKFQQLDTIAWAGQLSKKIKNEMFVLLDEDKTCILQYFLLKKDRIKSYTLFVKSGEALFFEY